MSAQVAPSSVDVGGPSKSDNRIFPSASNGEGILDDKQQQQQQQQHEYHMRQISNDNDEGVEVVLEGSGKSSVIDSPPRPSQDQNVFRAPHPVRPKAIRGVGSYPPPVQHGSGSYGGYGVQGHPNPYSHHSHHSHPGSEYGRHGHGHAYQSVPYANSGSFDQQDTTGSSSYPGAPPTSQYSPHVQYPPPGGRRAEDLNVISPNHKDMHSSRASASRHNPGHPGGPPHHPPLTPRSTGSRYPPQSSSSSSASPSASYQYPPASPVGRGSGSGIGPGSGSGSSPPRVRGYGMRRPEGPYSAAQRSRDETNGGVGVSAVGSWGYPTPDRPRPPVVAESSFDSEHQHHYPPASSSGASHSHSHSHSHSQPQSHSHSQPQSQSQSHSHPTTPSTPHYGGRPPHHGQYSDPSPGHYPSLGYPSSFDHGSSFDSHHHASYGPPPPSESPRHARQHPYDHDRHYYGHSPSASSPHSSHPPHPSHPPPTPHQAEVSPYPYGYSPGAGSSGGGYYDSYSPSPHAGQYGRPPPRSYDEHDHYHHHYPYHPHHPYPHHPNHYPYAAKKDEKSGILLPKAASEVDFDISDPPLEPSTPASKQPVCESPADVNSYDVLCGRGGGTNSQVGNRRFRKLVQEFQPIYLLARRKEKPLLARTIVLIIRKRGGRFLKKDEETGELYEVGDAKAEAKTSQALREGLDVRATKSAASSLMDKKKKKSSKPKDNKDKSESTEKDDDTNQDEAPPQTDPLSQGDDADPETESSPKNEPVPSESIEVLHDKAVVSPPGAAAATATSASAGDASNKTDDDDDDNDGDNDNDNERNTTPIKSRPESPPTIPSLNPNVNEASSKTPDKPGSSSEPGAKAPPSPEQMQFRKRRRMRSADGGSEPTTGTTAAASSSSCGGVFREDKLFPDFCPPRADLARAGSPAPRLSGDDVPHMAMCGMTPLRAGFGGAGACGGRNDDHEHQNDDDDDDDIRYEEDTLPGVPRAGCAGIALDMVTGAAAGSFCLGPRVWSKRR